MSDVQDYLKGYLMIWFPIRTPKQQQPQNENKQKRQANKAKNPALISTEKII